MAYLDSIVHGGLTELQRCGELDRTIVVITSDHGELFGEHGFDGHQSDISWSDRSLLDSTMHHIWLANGEELYEWRSDPDELTNLARSSAHAAIILRQRQTVDSLITPARSKHTTSRSGRWRSSSWLGWRPSMARRCDVSNHLLPQRGRTGRGQRRNGT
ncbi:MAG: hypothetical protein ACT4P6_05265 [Gemmatimonadaceae bacterium]